MNKSRVLFICIHNSSRSQMAEGFLRAQCGETIDAHSAGLEAGHLNPLVVESMRQVGIDISHQPANPIFDYTKAGAKFDWVITVCDETSAEKCPIFPGPAQRLHWSFPDPSVLTGTRQEQLAGVRKIRDEIRARIEMWCDEVCAATKAG